MKRKTILSALFSAIVACFFVACSNDCDALDINAGTRSAISSSYMTREEVQARLDEIGEKYGETIILVPETDTEKITEEFFIWIENLYQNDNKKKAIEVGTIVIDDEQIDKITIPEIGTYAVPGENVCYTGTFTANCNYYDIYTVRVSITWYSNTFDKDYITASSDHYAISDVSCGIFSGPVYNPSFEYSFNLNGVKYVGVYLGGGMSSAVM